jgi:hypothetical protein
VILKYHCVFGSPMRLDLEERFGARVEIEALEFVDALPIEWRLVSDALADFAWRPGMPERKTFAFHDLQVPSGNGTRGTKGCGLWLETRGIGSCLVLVWPREGTYSERSSALVSLQAERQASDPTVRKTGTNSSFRAPFTLSSRLPAPSPPAPCGFRRRSGLREGS